ncbi:hypothetical protein [Streptomyces sp. MBT53]|nr:hypothetical protein [Streptomyces sp. MBT53]
MTEAHQPAEMARILALQELDTEQEAGAFPCFSVSGSTITVRTL